MPTHKYISYLFLFHVLKENYDKKAHAPCTVALKSLFVTKKHIFGLAEDSAQGRHPNIKNPSLLAKCRFSINALHSHIFQ